MQTLYNSDSYVVVSFELPGSDDADAEAVPRGGYEIVDKIARKEIFIEGAVARSFQQGVQALVAERSEGGPEVLGAVLDDYIATFTTLAHQPVLLH